jgi:hypothetical protein
MLEALEFIVIIHDTHAHECTERERERERDMFLSTRVVAINKQIVKLKHNFTCSKKKKKP